MRPASADTAVAANAEPGANLTVHLLTMGHGDLVWEKFGHNAIWVRDASANVDVIYHWGLFDFADADFMSNFLKGDMRYSMGAFDLAGTIDAYRQANRTVWAQRLNLSPAERHRLNEFLMRNNLPENRKYSYDYYRDNCSTRVRDALDFALGGTIGRASKLRASGASYRFHTERLTQDDALVYIGTLAALGHPVDEPISKWEEMFLPVKLMEHLRSVAVTSSSGVPAPLVADERVLFQATRAPEESKVTRGPAGVIILVTFVLLVAGAMWTFSMRHGGFARPVLGLAAIWSVVAGVLGIVLAGLWMATNHVYSYRNENLLQATPLSLILAIMLVHLLWRTRASRAVADRTQPLATAAVISAIIAALSILGFAMQILPVFDQTNGSIIALAMPLHLGVAAVLAALFRQHRQSGLRRPQGDR